MPHQLPSGLWTPDPGDVLTWNGTAWVPAPPVVIPGPRGKGGGCGSAGPPGPPGPPGSNAVTVGEFQRNPDTPTTNSIVQVPFWSVGFTTSVLADILFQMVAVVFEAPPVADPSNFMGFSFTCDIDGNPLPDIAAFELNLQDASVNTSVETAILQSYIAALPAGAHVFNIFWATNDVDVTIISGNSNIAIQSL